MAHRSRKLAKDAFSGLIQVENAVDEGNVDGRARKGQPLCIRAAENDVFRASRASPPARLLEHCMAEIYAGDSALWANAPARNQGIQSRAASQVEYRDARRQLRHKRNVRDTCEPIYAITGQAAYQRGGIPDAFSKIAPDGKRVGIRRPLRSS